MDNNNSSVNVYSAITKLCERFLISNGKVNTPKCVARLKNKAFEILLFKSSVLAPAKEKADVFSELLAWEFSLAFEHNLQDYAADIDKNVNILKSSMSNEVVQGALMILLELKQLPKQENNIAELGDISKSFFKLYTKNDFKMNTSVLPSYKLKSFKLPEQTKRQKKKISNSSGFSNHTIEGKERIDDGYSSSDYSQADVWDQISTIKESKVKKWETYSLFYDHMEKPFLTELSSNMYSQLLNDHVLWLEQIVSTESRPRVTLISQQQFIKDVKNILFGIVSSTFTINEDGKFLLSDNILVENISKPSLKSFCKDIIFCGKSYRDLCNLIKVDPYTGQYKYNGFIFLKFCESIKKYLFYYNITVISISEQKGFFYFYNYIKKFLTQLQTLTSLKNCSPFNEYDKVSHGVALLNFIYHKILILENEENLILYSILYPCLQIYFEKFLKLWLLDGIINDPYNEFFIMSCPKYVSSRGRTYWTRSYLIKKDMVPDCLSGIEHEILNCGKAMNLLKLCSPNSSICKCLRDHKLNIIQFCLTSKELESLEETVRLFYLDVLCQSGPKFSIEDYIKVNLEAEKEINDLICMKRKINLQRYETERLLKHNIEMDRRRKEKMALNKEREILVAEKKELNEENKVKEQILIHKDNEAKKLEESVLKSEITNVIKYYEGLFEEVEKRDIAIKKNKNALKIQLDQNSYKNTDNVEQINNNPTEVSGEIDSNISKDNLDMINANISTINYEEKIILNEPSNTICAKNNQSSSALSEDEKNQNNVIISDFCLAHQLNKSNKVMTEAQKNKMKMMDIEFGRASPHIFKICTPQKQKIHLSDAEKNKLKVMSSEYYTSLKENVEVIKQESSHPNLKNNTPKEKKGNKIRKIDFRSKPISSLDTLNDSLKVQRNVEATLNVDVKRNINSKGHEEKIFDCTKNNVVASVKATSFKHSFNFSLSKEDCNKNSNLVQEDIYCKIVSKTWTNYFIKQGTMASIMVLKDLLQNKLLKYFIEDLKFLSHLESLRNFFFLLDGEFGKNMTEGMFVKLYDSDFPKDLINLNTLQHLVCSALDITSKFNENSKYLSIKINNLPKSFDLSDVSVLDCLSLSYKVCWPLNILLPSEAIGKYDEIFKFLLKIHRISWIVKNIFMDLKILAKEVGKRESFLLLSYHYQCVQQCRHVMTHFIQTLQNYIIGEVLQTSWANFEKSLKTDVHNLDQLYYLHTTYLKGILFMCWLNQRSLTIRKVLDNIFITIIKFYDYLRSRQWEFDVDCFVHPNFDKLLDIFNNFLNLVQFLFKAGHKVAKAGYQPELVRLVDMLDINDYYSNLSLKHCPSRKD